MACVIGYFHLTVWSDGIAQNELRVLHISFWWNGFNYQSVSASRETILPLRNNSQPATLRFWSLKMWDHKNKREKRNYFHARTPRQASACIVLPAHDVILFRTFVLSFFFLSLPDMKIYHHMLRIYSLFPLLLLSSDSWRWAEAQNLLARAKNSPPHTPTTIFFTPHTSLGLTRFIARRVLRGRFTLLLTHFSWLIQFQLDMMRKWIRRPSFFCTQPTTTMLKVWSVKHDGNEIFLLLRADMEKTLEFVCFFLLSQLTRNSKFHFSSISSFIHALENVNEISTPTFLTPAN